MVTNKRIKHSLEFGDVAIELIYKNSLNGLPTHDFVASIGYLRVATPELIAIDLFKYSRIAGGINHITIDENKLILLSRELGEACQIQRIGFMLEKIDVLEDEGKKKQIVQRLAGYLEDSDRPYVALVPYVSRTGHPKRERWKIIENTDFESDL